VELTLLKAKEEGVQGRNDGQWKMVVKQMTVASLSLNFVIMIW
jgi:hypothetical protein